MVREELAIRFHEKLNRSSWGRGVVFHQFAIEAARPRQIKAGAHKCADQFMKMAKTPEVSKAHKNAAKVVEEVEKMVRKKYLKAASA